jgi:hypothetical protein
MLLYFLKTQRTRDAMTEPRPFYNVSRGDKIVERLHAIERRRCGGARDMA